MASDDHQAEQLAAALSVRQATSAYLAAELAAIAALRDITAPVRRPGDTIAEAVARLSGPEKHAVAELLNALTPSLTAAAARHGLDPDLLTVP
jgi:hypothetical protein